MRRTAGLVNGVAAPPRCFAYKGFLTRTSLMAGTDIFIYYARSLWATQNNE
jgi:hypothetical protein